MSATRMAIGQNFIKQQSRGALCARVAASFVIVTASTFTHDTYAQSPTSSIGVSTTVLPACALSVSNAGQVTMRCRGEAKSGQIARSVRILSRDVAPRSDAAVSSVPALVGAEMKPASITVLRSPITISIRDDVARSASALRIITVEY
jgi:hypothetical protein